MRRRKYVYAPRHKGEGSTDMLVDGVTKEKEAQAC